MSPNTLHQSILSSVLWSPPRHAHSHHAITITRHHHATLIIMPPAPRHYHTPVTPRHHTPLRQFDCYDAIGRHAAGRLAMPNNGLNSRQSEMPTPWRTAPPQPPQPPAVLPAQQRRANCHADASSSRRHYCRLRQPYLLSFPRTILNIRPAIYHH